MNRQCSGAAGVIAPVIAIALILAGCASPSARLPEMDQHFALLGRQEVADPLRASEVYPQYPLAWRYLIVAGDDAGEEVVQRRRPADRFEADWADVEGEARTQFAALDDAGNIVIRAVIDHTERALSIFDPPLILAYETLEMNDARHEEVRVRIVDSRRPTRQRESGTVRRSLEYIDTQRIRTPMGEFDARRLVMRLEFRLGMARAVYIATVFVVPDVGVVAEDFDERIRILGLFERRRQQTRVLTDIESGMPGAPPITIDQLETAAGDAPD